MMITHSEHHQDTPKKEKPDRGQLISLHQPAAAQTESQWKMNAAKFDQKSMFTGPNLWERCPIIAAKRCTAQICVCWAETNGFFFFFFKYSWKCDVNEFTPSL